MSALHNFHRDFLWRVAGFPCEELEQFALDDLADRVRPHADATRGPEWSAWWRVQGPALTAGPVRGTFEDRFDDLRRRLGSVVLRPRFLAAVAYSSPSAAVLLQAHFARPPEARNSKHKRRELLAMRYLQRFVTKCETAAFVGPTGTGRIDGAAGRLTCHFDPDGYVATAFVGTRILNRLVGHLRTCPAVLATLRVRRRSGTALLGDAAVVHPAVGPLTLRPEALRVLRETTDATPVAALGGRAGCDPEQLLPIVHALVATGLLTDELDAVPHGADPLGLLADVLGRAAEPMSAETELVRLLGMARDEWATADAAGRAELLDTVERAVRACGIEDPGPSAQFYADGLAIVEDGICPASDLTLDDGWAEPMLAVLENELRRVLRRPVPGPVRAVAARLRDDHAGRAPLGQVLSWEVAAPAGDLAVEAVGPIVTSSDVMIAARDLEAVGRGEYQLVLSESHSAVGSAGFPTRVLPDPQAWLGSVAEFLTAQLAPARLVVATTPAVNKTSYLGRLPGVEYLEVGSPAPDGAVTVPVDDLDVVVDEPGLRLADRRSGEPVTLLPHGPRDRVAVLDAFRPATFGRTRLPGPRRCHGRVVQRRASWRITEADRPRRGARAFETFVWAQYVRARHGLPRWVVTRPDGERKPVCIDLSNPILCEELLRHLHDGPGLDVEEMFPSPDEAWVPGPGGRHLSELRLLYAAAS